MSNMSGKSVYIAETSERMRAYKENLVKELEHFGCVIKEVSDARQNIENSLEIIEQSEIAIHILSDNDQIIDSIGKGLEEQQINYSVQYYLSQKLLSESSEIGFKIFAWHPKLSAESIFEEEKTPHHLQRIQKLDEVDLLRTNFEEFKYYLLRKIEADTIEPENKFFIKGNYNFSIYFLYDLIDKEVAEEYIKYLDKRGFVVYSPFFSTDIMLVRQKHNSYLKKFDIAIIFASQAGINWVNMKIMDILKSPGLGRQNAILGKAVFIPEEMRKKMHLLNRGFNFISYVSNTSMKQIEEFLKKVLKE